jgi:acetyl/propionyl-CoA carboxylase alpha subunit/acetyl-CoA carboxylase carboxyltransferase component
MKKIGIVNRGEPALRFLNALDGLKREEKNAPTSVALYTEADRNSIYVQSAEESVCIGADRTAFLDADVVLKALQETQCDAAWLGWGFASEDGEFAEALEKGGIVLLAPRPDTMTALGDKIKAKQMAEANEVPVAPWAIVDSGEDALEHAHRIGFPLLLKAAGGGGGRGIRLVEHPDELAHAFVSARDEAARSFRSSGVFMEKFVRSARHIEVQVVGDGEGKVSIFGVRDCSLQRRRQKVIEECQAPNMDPAAIQALKDASRRLTEAVKYRSAGTVEFLYDLESNEPYFLEVNTRLQVEHPVTEEVFGTDLVRLQIELARGGALPVEEPSARGWAVEARVCAEDTQNSFTPAPGKIVRFVLPSGPGFRVDTGFAEGEEISAEFDPLIAKIIAWGPDRASAFGRLSRALEQTRILIDGGTTNLAFLRALLQRDDVLRGDVDIGLIDRLEVTAPRGAAIAMIAAAVDRFLTQGDSASGGERHRIEAGGTFEVYRIGVNAFEVVGDEGIVAVQHESDGPFQSWLTVDGERYRIERAPGDVTYLVNGNPHRVAASSGGMVTAPSAALVLNVPKQVGDVVEVGEIVATLESMKMEVQIKAAISGEIREILVKSGAQVKSGQALLFVEPSSENTAQANPTTVMPWTAQSVLDEQASERLYAAFLGWDFRGQQPTHDAELASPEHFEKLLEGFVDLAELFERRPEVEDGFKGQTRAITTDLWLQTLVERGLSSLPEAQRANLLKSLRHYGLTEDSPAESLSDPLRRIRRAGEGFKVTSAAVVKLLSRLEEAPIRLLDRLTRLDPSRFGLVREAADRSRYILFEKLAHRRLQSRSESRARALLELLRANKADWLELQGASESLVPSFAPDAAEGCEVAAEAVARRLEWSLDKDTVSNHQINGRPVFTVNRVKDGSNVLITTLHPEEVLPLLENLRNPGPVRRLDIVIVSKDDRDGHAVLESVIEQFPDELFRSPSWQELCLIAVKGSGSSVRRFYADGTERYDRRDVTPSTARRMDLDRLAPFDFKRLSSDEDVVLVHAHAWENRQDARLLAYGEVRSLEQAPGDPYHLPDVERVFHSAVRAMQTARAEIDSRKRLHWNRITIIIVPTIQVPLAELKRYTKHLIPGAEGLGIEKLVMRARFTVDAMPELNGELMDLTVTPRVGGGELAYVLTPASHKALLPMTPYQSQVVRARRRGLTHPYEVVRLLENGGEWAKARFEEYDIGTNNQTKRVADRPKGGNSCGIVMGVLRGQRTRFQEPLDRVLLLSDPTRGMGSLAEPECRRILAALELAERLQLPLEWVAVSAGAKIDWDSGTENLDWTAKVLRKLIEFTQDGGEVNILVPGICVGAQAYWNAEATMMMHTRGLLIMTDQGTMVLTGKRALDFSGCVSAEDDLALGGYTSIMGPNGQGQIHAEDLSSAYTMLHQYYESTYVQPDQVRPTRAETVDPIDRDISDLDYPESLDHGFSKIGDLFSLEHNPDRKRPFAIRPIMTAVIDSDAQPIERWAGMHSSETVVVWETHVGGYGTCLIGIENRPISRLGHTSTDGPDQFAAGTLYPQASRKLARALNAASGKRPVVVLANLSGFDGSPESLRDWQLEYGAEIGRAVTNFDGPITFVILSRYHGGAYVVFSKALNPELTSVAVEGSYASVIGGAPAAAVVFAGEVKKISAQEGGTPEVEAEVTQRLAQKFDEIHSVQRAKDVGSIDDIISAKSIRPFLISQLKGDYDKHHSS